MDTYQTPAATMSPEPAVFTDHTPPPVATLPRARELAGRSWQFTKRHAWRYIAVTGIAIIVQFVVAFVSVWLQPAAPIVSPEQYSVVAALLGVSLVASIYALALQLQAVVWGRERTVGAMLSQALQLLWPLSVGLFLIASIVTAGFLLLIIPGVILALLLSQAIWVLLTGEATGMAAVRRSIALVRGRFGYTMWQHFLALLPFVLFFFVLVIGVSVTVPLLFFMPQLMLPLAAALIVLLALGVVLGLYVSRYCYELYQGLVATAVPQTPRAWEGWPLVVLAVIGGVIVFSLMGASVFGTEPEEPYLFEDERSGPSPELERFLQENAALFEGVPAVGTDAI